MNELSVDEKEPLLEAIQTKQPQLLDHPVTDAKELTEPELARAAAALNGRMEQGEG